MPASRNGDALIASARKESWIVHPLFVAAAVRGLEHSRNRCGFGASRMSNGVYTFDTFDADLVDLKMKYRDRIADFAVHPIMEIYLGRQTMDG